MQDVGSGIFETRHSEQARNDTGQHVVRMRLAVGLTVSTGVDQILCLFCKNVSLTNGERIGSCYELAGYADMRHAKKPTPA